MNARTSSADDNGRDIFVRVRGLTFGRHDDVVFDRVNMDIPRARVTAIIGPAGAGKTVLLELISAQVRPAEGRVDVDGQDVHALDRPGLRALRRRIGMLFRSPALLADLDVFGNVALPLRECTGLPAALIRQLTLMRLESVGLRGGYRLMPRELSEGMARRVALARALALDPAMLLCDEPFAGQDPIDAGVLARLIRAANDALGSTAILGSRDAGSALSIADYAYVLADGEIVGRGTPEELRATKSPSVRQIVDGRADGPVAFHYPGPEYAEELFGDAASRGGRRG